MAAIQTLTFAVADGVELKGDLYLPDGPGPHPVLVAAPGGAWLRGDKKQLGHWGRHLAANGFAVFAVDYRRATNGKVFPKNVQDVMAAARFIQEQAASPVARSGPHRPARRLGRGAPDRRWPLWPKASRGWTARPCRSRRWLPSTASTTWSLTGRPISTRTPNLARTTRCGCWARRPMTTSSSISTPRRSAMSATPGNGLKTLVVWGADDGDVLPAQSQAFVRALRQARFFVRTIAVPGAGHFWFSEEPIDAPNSSTGKVAPGDRRLPQAAPGVSAMTYDVAIVGCGPVGALAANLLGRAGLSVLVLEQEAAPHPLPRAVHLDHEMMRLFQNAGLIERLAPLMRETEGHLHIGADGGVIRYLGTAGRAKRFGWANDYFFYQPELEAELRVGPGGLSEGRTAAGRATGRFGSGRRRRDPDSWPMAGQARARYVIACDGARSAVRKSLDVKLDDLDFEEPWLVVDAEVDGPIVFPAFDGVPDGANLQQLSVMLCDPRRPATIVPGRGNHRRWEFMLLPGEDDQAMMRPEAVEALIAPWVAGRTYRLVRAATYRFHGLVAERWQVGRVFLAGDAAHQTPPFFGQGMCHGLRDVSNLAWKLALVLDDRAGPGLLDTYQPERDPHVRAVIGAAVGAGRYICQLDPALAAQRDADLRAAMAAAKPGATAADLIPRYQAGVVRPEGGERFIQPTV
jgi:3-(3-hydroxy-phenyl)propionate hydroxylase